MRNGGGDALGFCQGFKRSGDLVQDVSCIRRESVVQRYLRGDEAVNFSPAGERKIIESAAAKAYRFLDLEFDGDAASHRVVGIANFVERAGGTEGLRCGFKKRGIEWGAGRN